jgi:hypothetical protein
MSLFTAGVLNIVLVLFWASVIYWTCSYLPAVWFAGVFTMFIPAIVLAILWTGSLWLIMRKIP